VEGPATETPAETAVLAAVPLADTPAKEMPMGVGMMTELIATPRASAPATETPEEMTVLATVPLAETPAEEKPIGVGIGAD
jgi:hypothetical protein